jgi:predicted TPR repeat methyltransferase
MLLPYCWLRVQESASPAYLAQLFDTYAPTFDASLQGLEYKVGGSTGESTTQASGDVTIERHASVRGGSD